MAVTIGNNGTRAVDIATSEKAGIVRPDNKTTSVDENGVISVIGIDVATDTETGVIKPDNITTTVDADGTIHAGYAPDGMKLFKAVNNNGNVNLYITEPSDTVVNDYTISSVAGVKIMKSTNGYPSAETDGTLVIDIKRADFGKHTTAPYVDTDKVANGTIIYYVAFPYSDKGIYNRSGSASNRTSVFIRNYEYYGFDINQDDPNPTTRVSYPEDVDNATFAPLKVDTSNGTYDLGSWANTFIIKGIRPVMLKSNGTVDYELNHSDQTKKLDGTASDINKTDYDGNAMVEFPKIYFKRWQDDDGTQHVRMSNVKIDDTYYAFACMASDGTEKNHTYLPMFEGSLINNKMRSLSGQAVSNSTTGANEITYCTANGAGWQMDDWSNTAMIIDLLFMMGKSTDVQTAFGRGHDSGGTDAASLHTTGKLVNKGMFYGSTDGTNGDVKIFYLENYYGDRSDRKCGMVTDSNGQILVKMYPPYNTDGTGYSATGIVPSGTSGGYINRSSISLYGNIPTTSSGSQSTYWSDGLWFNKGCFLLFGGACNYGLPDGCAVDLSITVSYAWWNNGASVSYK